MPELDEIRNERAGIGKQHRCYGGGTIMRYQLEWYV